MGEVRSVEEYWQEHVERSLRSLHVVPTADPGVESMVDSYADGRKGKIRARAWFNDDAYLDIVEDVEITDRPHRRRYSYQFMIEDSPAIRWHYEPLYAEPIRYHIDRPGEGHVPDEWRSLAQCADECWHILAEHTDVTSIAPDPG